MTEKYYIDYYTAAHYDNSLILCNEIPHIDDNITPIDEEGNYIEIFQYYLTDANDITVERKSKLFKGLIYSYSNVLNLYVLCVDHWGTDWRYVPCECSKEFLDLDPDKKFKYQK